MADFAQIFVLLQIGRAMGLIQIRPVNINHFKEALDFIARLDKLNEEAHVKWGLALKIAEDSQAKFQTVAIFVNDGTDELPASIVYALQEEDGTTTFELHVDATAYTWQRNGVNIYERTKVDIINNEMPVTLTIKSATTNSQHYTYPAEITRYIVGYIQE